MGLSLSATDRVGKFAKQDSSLLENVKKCLILHVVTYLYMIQICTKDNYF